MSLSSIGDLAQSLSMRQHNATLKAGFQRLTDEIATGQHHDLTAAVSGGFRPLAGLESSLSRLSAYQDAARQAVLLTDSLQAVLEQVNARSNEIAPRLLTGANSGNTELLAASSQSAKVELESVISALNTHVAGRALLSGEATDVTPLAPAEDILAAAKAAATGLTNQADITAALDVWFADGGDFETGFFRGSTTPASAIVIGEGVAVTEPLTAVDDDIKATIKGFVMATMVSENTNGLSRAERQSLAATSAETLLGASTGLITERGRIGANQGMLETQMTEISNEQHGIEMARNALIAIDPYEAATELQNIEASLELLYTMTARMSRLSLADFLR